MRSPLRTILAVATGALLAFTLAPATPAAAHGHKNTVITVNGMFNWEYRKTCDSQPPYDCYTVATVLPININVTNPPKHSPTVTIDYVIEDITAVHGVNYTGPTSGTVTLPGPYGSYQAMLTIPILDTGSVGGPDKTLRVRVTGSNVPGATIGEPGVARIYSGGQVPRDCDLARDADSFGITCTDRPSDQSWQVEVTCGFEWPMFIYVQGLWVTGNGTSNASCAGTGMPFRSYSYRGFS